MSLLPDTSGDLERRLEALGERYEFENPTSDLWNPWQCPESALIYLAWALSVDNWSEDWPLEVRREVVAKSLDIHRMKGTAKGLQDALNTLKRPMTALYWHQDPNIPKGKFRVKVQATGAVVDTRFYAETLAVINENKRGTLHLDKLEIQSATRAALGVAAVVKVGERIRITPRPPSPARTTQHLHVVGHTRVIDVITVKPRS